MSDEPLDLETLSISGQRPPPNQRQFRIRVDLAHHVVDQPVLTGREILTVAGKTPPDRFLLRQRVRGHQTRDIGLDDRVDLTEPGVERFTTLPRDQTDGIVRRQFALTAEDAAALNEVGLDWETVQDAQGQWVLVHGCPLPVGYNHAAVSIAIRLEVGYPRTPLDMAYYYPALALASGRAIPNSEALQVIDGESWQRWSRHYSPSNPWRPGVDTVATHLLLARDWLAQELAR